jgi:23S rRNA (uracil1939-C5)-methyltransferase
MGYADQLTFKSKILTDQLQRIGGIQDPRVEPAIASPAPWNYRNRLRFHVTSSGELAFHPHQSSGLMPVRECHLPQRELADLWPQIELEAGSSIREVEIRADNRGESQVILHGEGGPGVHLELDRSASVVWLEAEAALVLAGDPHLWMEIKGRSFRVSPGAFFQINSDLAGRLVDLVLDAVEVAADFDVNLDPYDRVSLYQASVEQALPELETRPDMIIVDPPRAGLARDVVDGLSRLEPKRIVYVSCDPATLARDGKRLGAAGYRLERITPIDLFPQTFHIESVSSWSPGD